MSAHEAPDPTELTSPLGGLDLEQACFKGGRSFTAGHRLPQQNPAAASHVLPNLVFGKQHADKIALNP
jgi:hypothetical protein